MQLHEACSAKLPNKKRLRVGRGPGSGIGKTSGRGLKGATARSGWTMKASYEGGQMPLFRRLPKRGFRNGPFRETFAVVNVSALSVFAAGSKIDPVQLREKGLVQGPQRYPVKVLGEGDLSVALTVSADGFSQSAIAKIQKAGGTIVWIGGTPKKPSPDFKKIEAEKKKQAAEKAKAKVPEGKDKGAKPQPKPEGGQPAKPAKPPKPQGPKPQAPQAPQAKESGPETPPQTPPPAPAPGV